jgi:hypothetical protein
MLRSGYERKGSKGIFNPAGAFILAPSGKSSSKQIPEDYP